MVGITSFGAYIPLWRIKREVIGRGGKGEKSVGNFDEDSLTMAVASSVEALKDLDRDSIDALLFASTTFPYKEKQNACLVAAAADLRTDIFTADVSSTLRGGTAAMKMAADMVKAGSAARVLVTAADCRLGTPGSGYEQSLGDSAATVIIGDSDVAVEIEGGRSVYNEIIDVWRSDDDKYVRSWDERFIQSQGYIKTVIETVQVLMKEKGLTPQDFAKVVLYAPDPRRMSEAAMKLGFDLQNQVQDPHLGDVGNTGTASSVLLLIAALEKARPGDRIMVVSYGDGCDALIFKVTEHIENLRSRKGLSSYLETKQYINDYPTYLEWKGVLHRERGPGKPAQEVSLTALRRDWSEVIRFRGSKCRNCGTVQYPPQRICTECHRADQLELVRLSDKKGKLFTFSEDFISDPLDVPMVLSVVDFESGGRAVLTMTDHIGQKVSIGMPVEMSFRKLFYNDGIHNYFWKCTPSLD